MRSLSLLATWLLLAAWAAAADLTVKVVDPHSAAVSGARVALFRGGTRALTTSITGADGAAVFPDIPAGEYRVNVLVPGFAPATASPNVSQSAVVTLRLTVAVATNRLLNRYREKGTVSESIASSSSTKLRPVGWRTKKRGG